MITIEQQTAPLLRMMLTSLVNTFQVNKLVIIILFSIISRPVVDYKHIP